MTESRPAAVQQFSSTHARMHARRRARLSRLRPTARGPPAAEPSHGTPHPGGGDPRAVWRQWANDRQAMIDAGIPEALVDATLGDPTMNSGANSPQGESAGDDQ